MNLHEDQAKQILAEFGLPIPKWITIDGSEREKAFDQASNAWDSLNSPAVMGKGLVHTGGRGKVGLVKYITSREKLIEFVNTWLGKQVVTHQTGPAGLPVNRLLVTMPCDIAQELYLSLLIDRKTQHLMFIASVEGGVEIEEVAESSPDKIFTVGIAPFKPLISGQKLEDIAHRIGSQLNLPFALIQSEFTRIIKGMYDAFIKYDLSLIEINPLIIDKAGHMVCLDAKITGDENALFRQSKLLEWRDPTQEDPREHHAREWGLNYIALEGKIGCMVNGAGLAMATMDLIKSHGGEPANFLDIGGTATKERVAEAFQLILSDTNVKGVFVNIFGGIVRCDMVAEGIISAIAAIGVKVPVMVRLVGNQADKGIELLKNSGLKLMASEDLTAAAKGIISEIE